MGSRNHHEVHIVIGHHIGIVFVTARNRMLATNCRKNIRLFPADGSDVRMRVGGKRFHESPAHAQPDHSHA